nr:TetR/AcrR family transcriptional regulator [Marinicaulis flavus]
MTAAAPQTKDQRNRLLTAAARCFVKSGFRGARMAQIAAEAQMSTGHIYHYFDSKEQIIAEMVRGHIEEKESIFGRLERAGDQVVDLMVDNLEESVDSSANPFWSALTLEMTAEAMRNPKIADILRTADAEMKARLFTCLGEGSDQEELATRLEIFIALIQGIGIRNIINPKLDLPAVVSIVKEVVENLFRRSKP